MPRVPVPTGIFQRSARAPHSCGRPCCVPHTCAAFTSSDFLCHPSGRPTHIGNRTVTDNAMYTWYARCGNERDCQHATMVRVRRCPLTVDKLMASILTTRSMDDGKTWATPDAHELHGHVHHNLLTLPDGRILMTCAARLGELDGRLYHAAMRQCSVTTTPKPGIGGGTSCSAVPTAPCIARRAGWSGRTTPSIRWGDKSRMRPCPSGTLPRKKSK